MLAISLDFHSFGPLQRSNFGAACIIFSSKITLSTYSGHAPASFCPSYFCSLLVAGFHMRWPRSFRLSIICFVLILLHTTASWFYSTRFSSHPLNFAERYLGMSWPAAIIGWLEQFVGTYHNITVCAISLYMDNSVAGSEHFYTNDQFLPPVYQVRRVLFPLFLADDKMKPRSEENVFVLL